MPLLDASLRPLDRATFRLADHYALDNFTTLVQRPVYAWIGLRTLLAAVIVTAAALVLAFPYAWVMVRTQQSFDTVGRLFVRRRLSRGAAEGRGTACAASHCM